MRRHHILVAAAFTLIASACGDASETSEATVSVALAERPRIKYFPIPIPGTPSGEGGNAKPNGDGGAGGAPAECVPAECRPGECKSKDDGCGNTIPCDPQCGDGVWLTCSAANTCICWHLPDQPAYAGMQSMCSQAGAYDAFFCGGQWNQDFPAGCWDSGKKVYGNPVWCCPQ